MSISFEKHFSDVLPDYLNYKYVVAVSGGVDSMVLLNLMNEVLPADKLVVAHFDHRTRQGESFEDAQFVEKIARKMNLVFELKSRRLNDLSENGLRLERKQFLESICEKHQCDFVVLAHHLQDQLETFLMRLLRGTGLDGLAVMEPKHGRWLRPLLGVSKEAIEKEAVLREIAYRTDSSNLVPQNFRTAVRLNLLPQMEMLSERYGGKEKWLQRLEPLFSDLRVLKKETHRRVAKNLELKVVYTEFWARIPRKDLESFSYLERRRVIRAIVSRMGIDTLSSRAVSQLEQAFLEKKKKSCVTGLEVVESCGFIYFVQPSKKCSNVELVYRSENFGTVCDLLGLRLRANLSADDFEFRQFRPGDRYRGKKMKEYFLKKRIPMCERKLIPVLAKKQSGEIEWVFPEEHPHIRIESVEFPFAIKK